MNIIHSLPHTSGKGLRPLAFAVLGALLAQGAVADVLTKDYDFTGTEVLEGVKAENGQDITVTGDTITFSGTNPVIYAATSNRPTEENLSTISIGTADTKTVSITSSDAYALRTNGGDLTIRGENIDLTAGTQTTSTVEAMRFGGYGTANIGGEETKSLSIRNGSGDGVVVMPYYNGSSSVADSDAVVNLTADVIDINARDYAIWVQNNSTGHEGRFAKLNITADELHINAKTGIVSFSQGDVTIKADTYINATSDAIISRGDSKVTINEDGTHVVQMKGDINFNYDEDTSKTGVNADVLVRLSGENSFWEGNSLVSWGTGKPASESGKLDVNNFSLDLSNGAQWIATTIDTVDDEKSGHVYTALNSLTLNNGVITLSETDTKVQVKDMTGTGGTLNVAAATTDDGITTASIQIDKAAADASLNVNLTGVTADDVGSVEALETIVDGAVTGDGKVRQTRSVAEGDIIGKITQTVDAEGKMLSSSVAKNTKLDAFEGVNASTLMAWRNEINHLTKRLGDIRDEASSMGAWARVYGGESTYSDAVDVEVDQTTVQVGLDGRLGDWIVGGAFSYSNGDADITNGEADSDGYTFAIYGTRFFESGAYVDAIARVGRLSTDVTAGDMKGSYDNNAFSLSAELGHNFKFLERAFVEPQVELTYGYVTGDDFSPKAGVKIEQDDFQMLIARLGARAGWEFERNAGRLYAQASVNHDFLGDADGEASEGNLHQDLNADLGGTWLTYGVGFQFRPTEKTSFYGELERSTGGEVKDHYTFNVGARYAW